MPTSRAPAHAYAGATKLVLPGLMFGAALQHWSPDLLLRFGAQRHELDVRVFPLAHVELHLLGRAGVRRTRRYPRYAGDAPATLLPMRRFAMVALAACASEEASVEPSWQVDVMPLVAANCVRCHAYPFRGDGISRAAARLVRRHRARRRQRRDRRLEERAADLPAHARDRAVAPINVRCRPIDELDEYELAVIHNWASLGNGETAIRGPGRADNGVPELVIEEVARDATSITFAYELRIRIAISSSVP